MNNCDLFLLISELIQATIWPVTLLIIFILLTRDVKVELKKIKGKE